MAANRSAILKYTAIAGFIGSISLALGSLITGLVYVGAQGERYSPINHWVSELGEIGVSQFAALFNISLFVGGLSFIVFMIGLALYLRSRWAYLFGLIGVISGIAGALVGVFPMNNIGIHTSIALTFFNLGWIAVGLFSLYFWFKRDPALPRWLTIIGAACVVSFVGFLAILGDVSQRPRDALGVPIERLDFWWATIFEWLIIVTIILWVFAVALALYRYTRREVFSGSTVVTSQS
ncbi:MAG: DUF998 domain-containing protein [Anaerolineae bacterium]